MTTENDIRAFMKSYEKFNALIEERATKYIELNGFYGDNFYIDYWEFSESGELEIVITQTGRWSFSETATYDIPLEYLWDDNWEEKEKARLKEKKMKKENLEQQKEAEAARQREEKDQTEYKRLKEKFEGEQDD